MIERWVVFAFLLCILVPTTTPANAFDLQSRIGNVFVPLHVGINCCGTVNTADFSNGLVADVDLKNVNLFLPSLNRKCSNAATGSVSNYLASVVPNKDLPSDVVPTDSWAELIPWARLLINANFFAVTVKDSYTVQCLAGLGYTINNGRIISVYNTVHKEDTSTLVFFRTPNATGARATIMDYFTTYQDYGSGFTYKNILRPDTESIAYGISGLWFLQDGKYVEPENLDDFDQTVPRTIVGLSNDGNALKILVINPGSNTQGATLPAVANWMVSQGINNALDLDGSGSSQLYFRDPPTITSKPSDARPNTSNKYYRPVPIYIGFQ